MDEKLNFFILKLICINNGGFESIYFIVFFFGIIGICKHVGFAFTSDLGLDVIKLELVVIVFLAHSIVLIVLHF